MSKNTKNLIIAIIIVFVVVLFLNWNKKREHIIYVDPSLVAEEEVQTENNNGVVVDSKPTSGNTDKADTPELSNDNGFAPVGSYEVYSPEKIAEKSKTSRVVLFFNATWCPTCRSLDRDIKSNLKTIPGDITILSVDYDTYSDLKQKYGITYQHTMVQVDASGKMLKKWSGSSTLEKLILQVI